MARRRGDDMPARVERVNGSYYYRAGALGRRAGEPRKNIPLGADREDARQKATTIERNLRSLVIVPRSVLRQMLVRAKARAKLQRVPFDLSVEYVEELALENNGRCAITQIPFSYERRGFRCSPWAMSIDRIESKAGYARGNVRLVCHAVNVALNEWGIDVLEQVARAVVGQRRRQISRRVPEIPEGLSA